MDEHFWRARRTAEARTARGGLAGLAHAMVYLVLGAFSAMAGTLRSWNDALPFAYAVVLLLLALATARQRRIAAAVLLALTLWMEGGAVVQAFSLVSLILVMALGPTYAMALAGAVAWHRQERERVHQSESAPAT